MKSWMLISILLLSVLIHEAQGRIIRRLITNFDPTNVKMARKDENEHSGSVNNEQQQPVYETYPDTLEIAGMDYSLARRKPPIHN
ncbi:hypothetical protein CASFOL_032766 [Castilleja foliolosa]|uniref:Uncharacterized protein n=1 Tax=Castilleja foliolosa TaxID=1961234 RepID=A0ABD3C531_9LAMI